MPTEQQLSAAIKAGYTPQQIKLALARAGQTQSQGKTVGGFIGNVGKSAVSNVGAITSAITHPVETVKNIGKTSIGALQLLQPGEQGWEDSARNVGSFYKDRYGSLDKIGNTLYNDPVGVALDASTVLGGAGAVAKSVGGAAKIGELGRVGEALTTASKLSDPFQVAGKGVSWVSGGVGKKLAPALVGESNNVLTRAMGNPAQLKKTNAVLGASGVTMSDLFKKYNTYDRTPETFGSAARQAGENTKALIAEAGAKGITLDVPTIVRRFDEEIAKLRSQAGTSDKAALAAEELARRKEMFLTSIGNTTDGLISTPLTKNVDDVYKIKSDFQGDVPPSTFGMPTQDIGKTKGTTQAYRTLLDSMEEVVPGIKQSGREQSALIKLKDMAKSQRARGAAKRPISLPAIGSFGVGGLVGGLPGAAAGLAIEQIASHPRFLAAESAAMKNIGQFLETGRLPEVLTKNANRAYSFGKSGRVVNDKKKKKNPFRNRSNYGNVPTLEG